jgi:pyruvate-formate lyase-activating enzyme
MLLEEIYNEIEELENNLEYYQNRLEQIKCLVTPQAVQFDKIIVDGGKHTDQLLKYVEIENEQQLEVTILYIKGKLKDLYTLKDKEIDRLSKYGESIKAVVYLREREFIKDGKKKRHLTWQEIADKVYCSERSAKRWYKLGTEERKRVLS